MSCFICGEENVSLLKTFESDNNVKLQVCNYCFEVLLYQNIRCSYCNIEVNEDNHLNAKIGRNGIICTSCLNNGVVLQNGSFIFKRVYNNFKSYGYKPSPVFHKLDNEQDNLYMGVELEIGGLNSYEKVKNFCDDHGGHIFYFKSDGSIRGEGCEIVSHPATLKYHLSDNSAWRELFNDFNQIGFVSGESTNTGLHIHVNRNILTTSQIKKIDLLVNHWQRLFKCIGRRTLDSYCRYREKLHSHWGQSEDRYQSVNFSNRNTVEFRFFCGTNKFEELFASLEAVKIIIIMTKDITYDDLYENEDAVKNKMKEVMKSENCTYFSKMMVEKTGDTTWGI